MGDTIILKKVNFKESEALRSFMDYAIGCHNSTNHYYDDYIPYEFHLRMAFKAGKDFIHLLPSMVDETLMGVIGHDLIEDARASYNDVITRSCKYTAEIIRACTNNGRGRNRDERMPDYIYEEIKNTPGALFTKLCDRIANVQYGRVTGGSMYKRYQKEHSHFKSMLYTEGVLDEMWEYLENILNTPK